MPSRDGHLYGSDIAARLGIVESTWRSYVARAQAPRPDGYVAEGGRLRAVWKQTTIAAYERRNDTQEEQE